MADPRAMRSVIRLHRHMTAVLDTELKNGFGLRLIEYEILQQLCSLGAGTCLLSELARRLSVHATTVSIAIDRLAPRDLVQRRTHPTDRRAVMVTITDAGRELTDAVTAALAKIDFGLADLTDAQRETLSGLAGTEWAEQR
ncbi:MarR family transcriptional regulator [Mycolicibacterium sp. S2-37]|uniref:MarR family winged helix-turn-helix transcriptional regulator n=1 Tax=Mycolicibacterium sp. S2-37 TaxID=2810297 RepID=UPI001A93D55F|nr:MarR family transcriptional regulator [Mycolicibacterium sp. S2-37]MBO0677845.1 MarR family transcriptional regulator [Mycolicibacterium sp. S2-37]